MAEEVTKEIDVTRIPFPSGYVIDPIWKNWKQFMKPEDYRKCVEREMDMQVQYLEEIVEITKAARDMAKENIR